MIAFAIAWVALAALLWWVMDRGLPRVADYFEARGTRRDGIEASFEARIQADQQRIDTLERRLAYARAELRRMFPRGTDAHIVERRRVQELLDEIEAEAEWRHAS